MLDPYGRLAILIVDRTIVPRLAVKLLQFKETGCETIRVFFIFYFFF